MPQHDVVASFTRVSKRYGTTEALRDVDLRIRAGEAGGQKQRLHLALALGGNPELLFLDEPTAGLDVMSRRALRDGLRKLVDVGRAVVLTTHYIEEAEALADQIVVLDQGRVIAWTPAEIKRATPRGRIAAFTKLETRYHRRIAEYHSRSAEHNPQDRTEIFASRPEPVVHQLLALDPERRDLEVTRTTLEKAFLTLTRSDFRE